MEMFSRLIDRFNCKCYVHRCYTAAFKHTRMRHRLLSIRQPLIVIPAFQGEMKGVIVILILFLLNFFVSFLAAAHCGSVESSFIKQSILKIKVSEYIIFRRQTSVYKTENLSKTSDVFPSPIFCPTSKFE